MNIKITFSVFALCIFLFQGCAHTQNSDSVFIRSIYDKVLSNGKAYEDLRSLCKDVGARLSGSAEAEMAVLWGEQRMKRYGFDTVYLQEVMVPHWERGTTESGWYTDSKGTIKKVNLLALGGSIGTNGLIKAEIVEFMHLDELKNADSSEVTGKIVFLNQPMDEKQISTFKSYGGCYPIRGMGGVEAAKKGAIALIIRSLGMPIDEHPHTGSMYYVDSVEKIPAAAVSTKDADQMHEDLKRDKVYFMLEMDCRNYPDKLSYNVIGELKGKKANEFITFGGHLDSWDTGEGAHDDGAGIVHALEAMRVLKELDYQPNYTLRAVFFMNEENGNMGGKTYAKTAFEKGEKHIAAIESDRGGFSPRGFHCDGSEKQIKFLKSLGSSLKPYDLLELNKGYGGVDISPLKDFYTEIPLFGLVPDSQRYFDFHHAPSDVFENVNKRELELGAGAIATLVYLLDQSL
jgi:hypothetical protein